MADTITETEIVDKVDDSTQVPDTTIIEETKKDSEPETNTVVETDTTEPETIKETGSKKKEEEPQIKPTKKELEADPEIDKLPKEKDGQDSEINTLTKQLELSQSEVTKHISRTAELEKVIAGLVENKVASIPEAFKELMPEGDPIKQLEWITKAEAKGIFNKEKPELEIGKNMALDKKGEQKAKEELTSHQRMSNYFSKAFSGN